MMCQVCNEQPATVHLTQVVNGQVRELHLCEECAEKSGMNVQNALSLPEMLLEMSGATAEESKGPERVCPHCHMRSSDFKKTSRFGCPVCYATFADELAALLPTMHKGQQHTGKTPAAAPLDGAAGDTEMQVLQKSLEAAIAAERYEEAARLRDQIGTLRMRLAAEPHPPGEKATA
jgi:protein arginine kinase activator